MDRAVREVFDFVEDNLRFKYVQLGKAYIDLLRQALIENNQEKKSEEIYDFPLSLELGVSSIAGCCGQLKLATALEFFQYRFSDSFGGNPPLYSCGLSAL
ncbi:hypothetical protein JRT27AECX_JRT27AEC_00615 [Escherichia coli]|nr:hypothetical protein JRT27AECX_JRT27AEC_00615 [Escherichia coli]